ncbi:MAG: hypothetical protein JW827_12940 [Spirochaetes bacterium]|nr:hypothetical protein [Spirochaetota bacterium]
MKELKVKDPKPTKLKMICELLAKEDIKYTYKSKYHSLIPVISNIYIEDDDYEKTIRLLEEHDFLKNINFEYEDKGLQGFTHKFLIGAILTLIVLILLLELKMC